MILRYRRRFTIPFIIDKGYNWREHLDQKTCSNTPLRLSCCRPFPGNHIWVQNMKLWSLGVWYPFATRRRSYNKPTHPVLKNQLSIPCLSWFWFLDPNALLRPPAPRRTQCNTGLLSLPRNSIGLELELYLVSGDPKFDNEEFMDQSILGLINQLRTGSTHPATGWQMKWS